MKFGLKNCRLFDGEKFFDTLMNITINDGIVEEISRETTCNDIFDCEGSIITPGYVDIHTHGIAGFDNSDFDEKSFSQMVNEYVKRGTTTFIPSFPTISSDTAFKTLSIYKNHKKTIKKVHLEGPFINTSKKGAQNPDFIETPDVESFIKYVQSNDSFIGRVTISPELDRNFELTKFLIEKNIIVSFGHTTCNFEKATEFFKITDSIATHLFNAMPIIHHREPGITLAALMNDNIACEIIPDLIHLHPEIIKLVFKLKGAEKTICISDSIVAAGLKEGKYVFSGLDINVTNKSARLKDGNLAGSIITMADGVKNMVSIGIDTKDALISATSSPAKAMRIENEAGYIRVGAKADILILSEDYSIKKVIKDGKFII